jgi:DNA-binding Lrp family transcriptional regulator
MSREGHRWTIISKHGLVLIFLGRNRDCTIVQIADALGITPRQTFRIVKDLIEDGYLQVNKQGRRNVYSLHPEKPLRHPLMANVTLADLLSIDPATKPD